MVEVLLTMVQMAGLAVEEVEGLGAVALLVLAGLGIPHQLHRLKEATVGMVFLQGK